MDLVCMANQNPIYTSLSSIVSFTIHYPSPDGSYSTDTITILIEITNPETSIILITVSLSKEFIIIWYPFCYFIGQIHFQLTFI